MSGASIEVGAAWWATASRTRSCRSNWPERRSHFDGELVGRPSTRSEHRYVAPFPEEDVEELATLIGADRVLFGSDWPHPEGVAHPGD